jgi:hypothetical protein
MFPRKLVRLQLLHVIAQGLVARGNLNYIENPGYILMLKKYKKKVTPESVLDAVRVSNDDDNLSSSLSVSEQ